MNSQKGFNLIDLMIGLAISLVGMLAVAQVMMTFSQQRNTTVQAMESNTSGTMAMYLMERDLGQAGYGMMPMQSCSQIQWYYQPALQPPISTLPVSIADGGTGSDTLTVQYANTFSGAPGAPLTQTQATYTDPYIVSSVAGYSTGSLVVAITGASCTLAQVTSVNTLAQTVAHAVDANPALTPYNSAVSPPPGATAGWVVAQTQNMLANLGSFTSKRYSVTNGQLQVASFPTYTNSNLVDGIVLLKAQYGLDTSGNGAVDTWVNGTTAVTNANSRQVLAIRIGIVARSPLYEKEEVDAPTTLTVLPAITGETGTATAAVTYTVPDRHYRYKAYSTIIPLRNIIWAD